MAVPTKKLTLKIAHQGDVRRLRDWPAGDAHPTVDGLQTAVCKLFELELSETDALTIKYRDEEGDWCTIAEPSLPDALMCASETGVLRLIATVASDGPVGSMANEQRRYSREEPSSSTEPSPLSRVAGFISDRLVDGQAHATDFISDRLTEGRHHASHATCLISEQLENGRQHLENGRQHATEHFSDVRRNATDQYTEVHRHASVLVRSASERFEIARPHLSHGVNYFKQQVVDDFKTSCKDMEDAFGAKEHQSHIKGKVRTVAGAATGLVAALRLAPVRATRLAAHSVASIVSSTPPASTDTYDTQTEETEEPTSSMDEFGYFKHQVKKDFKTVSKDVKAALGCIMGGAPTTQPEEPNVFPSTADSSNSTHPGSSEEHEGQNQQQHIDSSKVPIPEVVSTVAGATVAACLVPLRAARLVVAKLANDSVSVDEVSNSNESEEHLRVVSSEAPASTSSNETLVSLVVESAFYGGPADDAGRRQGADVTEMVRALVHDDELRINESESRTTMNQLFGDPAPGVIKVLEVQFRYGVGPVMTHDAGEYDSFVITRASNQ